MTGPPIKLPLPLGKVLMFDHIVGKVYVVEATDLWKGAGQ